LEGCIPDFFQFPIPPLERERIPSRDDVPGLLPTQVYWDNTKSIIFMTKIAVSGDRFSQKESRAAGQGG